MGIGVVELLLVVLVLGIPAVAIVALAVLLIGMQQRLRRLEERVQQLEAGPTA